MRREHVGAASNGATSTNSGMGPIGSSGSMRFTRGMSSRRRARLAEARLAAEEQARIRAELERRRVEEQRRRVVESQRQMVTEKAKKLGNTVQEKREGDTLRPCSGQENLLMHSERHSYSLQVAHWVEMRRYRRAPWASITAIARRGLVGLHCVTVVSSHCERASAASQPRRSAQPPS